MAVPCIPSTSLCVSRVFIKHPGQARIRGVGTCQGPAAGRRMWIVEKVQREAVKWLFTEFPRKHIIVLLCEHRKHAKWFSERSSGTVPGPAP